MKECNRGYGEAFRKGAFTWRLRKESPVAEVFRRRRLRSFTLSRNVKLPFSSFFFSSLVLLTSRETEKGSATERAITAAYL